MNKPALLLLLLPALCLSSLTVTAAESVGTISTLTGKVYRRCQVVKVHPDGVFFTHSQGAAKILFADLPQNQRVKLGYNAAKAAAHDRDVAERRERDAEARAARQAELSQAYARAQEVELQRLRLAQQQTLFLMQGAPAGDAGFGYSYPLMLPIFGGGWDGRYFQPGRGPYAGHGLWGKNGRWNRPLHSDGNAFGSPAGAARFNGAVSKPRFGAHPHHGGSKGTSSLSIKP